MALKSNIEYKISPMATSSATSLMSTANGIADLVKKIWPTTSA